MNATASQTVEQAYKTRRREIAALIGFIECELDAHAARSSSDGMHWGHTGDLDMVRQSLKNALVYLVGGSDEETTGSMIEDAISDALA